jgi:hypothetical protein
MDAVKEELPNTELEKLGGESTRQMNGGRESRRPRLTLDCSVIDDDDFL